MEEEIERKPNKNANKIIAIGIIIILLIIIIVLFSQISKLKSQIKNSEDQIKVLENKENDWIVDNCQCLERNNLECSPGYRLDNRTCVKLNTDKYVITNPTKKCSKYQCPNFEVNIST